VLRQKLVEMEVEIVDLVEWVLVLEISDQESAEVSLVDSKDLVTE
jgi:hypothetical protein